MGITNPALRDSVQNLSGSAFVGRILSNSISLGFVIGAVVFVFIILWGAIQWISSGGDKVAYESAKQKMTNAAVGLIILFSLFAIINLVELFFGVDIMYFDLEKFSLTPPDPLPTGTLPPTATPTSGLSGRPTATPTP